MHEWKGAGIPYGLANCGRDEGMEGECGGGEEGEGRQVGEFDHSSHVLLSGTARDWAFKYVQSACVSDFGGIFFRAQHSFCQRSL